MIRAENCLIDLRVYESGEELLAEDKVVQSPSDVFGSGICLGVEVGVLDLLRVKVSEGIDPPGLEVPGEPLSLLHSESSRFQITLGI